MIGGCLPRLKSIEDAQAICRNVLLAYERAEMEPDAEARERLLTFVLVGAGLMGSSSPALWLSWPAPRFAVSDIDPKTSVSFWSKPAQDHGRVP